MSKADKDKRTIARLIQISPNEDEMFNKIMRELGTNRVNTIVYAMNRLYDDLELDMVDDESDESDEYYDESGYDDTWNPEFDGDRDGEYDEYGTYYPYDDE